MLYRWVLFISLTFAAICQAAETTYTYPLVDFPSDTVVASTFKDEIDGAGGITTTLVGISADGTNVQVTFEDALSSGELDVLRGADYPAPVGGLIAAHDSSVPVSGFEIFFPADLPNASGSYKVADVGTNGSLEFSFHIPSHVRTIKEIALVGISSTAAEGASKDIDLASEYGSIGEAKDIHSETSTAATYTLPADKVLFELDALPVFSNLAAGDSGGLKVTHNTIGGTVSYLGVRVKCE